jgi:hypothetical protein
VILAGLTTLLAGIAAGCGYVSSSTSASPSVSASPWQAGNPVARLGGVSFYDHDIQKVFIFGGAAQSGPGAGTAHGRYLSDMWAWDGLAWRAVPPAAADQVPAGLVGAFTAYDPDHKRILLLGGQDQPRQPYLHQLWSWAGGRWTRLPDAPASVDIQGAAMAYDAAGHDLVVVTMPPTFVWGGDPTGVLMDTWLYDGSVWRLANPAHKVPYYPTAMVFDSSSRHVLLSHPTPDATQVWSWDGRDWTVTAESTSSDVALVDGGDLGTLAMDQGNPLARPGQPRPAFRLQGGHWSAAGPVTVGPATVTAPTYDQHRNELVAFSDIWSADGTGQTTSDDTWTWTLAAGWTKHTGSTVTTLPVPWRTPTQSVDYDGHLSPGEVHEIPVAIAQGETLVLHFRWGHAGDKLQFWQTKQAGTTTPQQWATSLDISSNHDDSMYLGPAVDGINGFGVEVVPGTDYLVISDIESPPNEWWHLTIDRYKS